MKYHRLIRKAWVVPGVVLLIAGGLVFPDVARGQDKPESAAKKGEDQSGKDAKTVELDLKLPKPAFKGTPVHVPPGTNLEDTRKGPRPPLKVPEGTKNVSAGKPVSSSDEDPIIGEIKCITDGDKEATEGGYVELGPGVQWVQIDLKSPHEIHAVVVWHYHLNARVYHDVVVQVADDEDFIENVRTVFNNDHDNSAGLGLGEQKEYWDTYEGKLITVGGVKARYLRLYSNGSTEDDQNHYTEVEVFGIPAS